ncbi:uncharacterized protein B0I36DRAFT_361673 [Microdochium trichocladiopsis]|uniref:Uncharacterized protein n=1 Tax=Microdochium trichocladiopsis TaxID=1682393 RepID=A0A9P9BRL2_9PEZI|nr:uncharacterized protein B0I36DRAFT_361673 [Microdochium trichocladiopsis]KAH7032935.1 hypothetical protein B0I36DRAFT_361673 [Microdochium trichocladiopsis]
MASAAAYSGYYQEPSAAFATNLPQSALPYQSEYAQDGRQTQGFGTYNPSMMYNVPQSNAQGAVYDASQPFQPRQGAGIPMMGAEVATSYFPNEAAGPGAGPSGIQAQQSSAGASNIYQQGSGDQRSLMPGYPSGMASMGGMAQGSAGDQSLEEQDYSGSAEMGEAYEQYQTALKEIFTNVQRENLKAASESLLNVSDWLLTKVIELGLASDNQSLHNDRIKLWHEFNHAWLALLQKQKDMTKADDTLQQEQSKLTVDGLKRMGRELIRLCDGIERHGLVDYEYGVWEDRIVEALEDCLDLLEGDVEDADPGASPTQATR